MTIPDIKMRENIAAMLDEAKSTRKWAIVAALAGTGGLAVGIVALVAGR
jgi:hypothetical protein